MAELIAQGLQPKDRWKRPLPPDEPVTLGRDAPGWAVPWDHLVSRRHAELTLHNGRLAVRRLPEGRNPILVRGDKRDHFELRPGDHFVIGSTVFSLAEEQATPSPDGQPVWEMRTISPQELRRLPFRDAPHRIDVLNQLPQVILGASNDTELFVHLVNMLLAGVPRADTVALVELAEGESAAPVVVHWDSRLQNARGFQPSRRLVTEAVRKQQTALHVWGTSNHPDDPGLSFTMGNFDWAFCTPLRNEACPGWAIYVAGHFAGDAAATILAPWETNELGDDLKFTELVASILGSLRQVAMLQRKQALLSQFIPPAVVRVLHSATPEEALQPQESDITVLFCDLRGFAQRAEKNATRLLDLLERVSKALGVMTQNIHSCKGVVADFQGDAAMGFWGWPRGGADQVLQACQAALGIYTMFRASAQRKGHPLENFEIGIGIATGRAVAGKVGPPDQLKVTVFGPVVNLASRLEGMTKILRVPILLDETTANLVRQRMPAEVGRVRRMAKVLPYKLETPVVVSELLPPEVEYPLLKDEHLRTYEAALDLFENRRWPEAYALLAEKIPSQDTGKEFLLGYLLNHYKTPPNDFDGVIKLKSKRGDD